MKTRKGRRELHSVLDGYATSQHIMMPESHQLVHTPRRCLTQKLGCQAVIPTNAGSRIFFPHTESSVDLPRHCHRLRVEDRSMLLHILRCGNTILYLRPFSYG